MAYDKAKWHYDADDYPDDLPTERAGTHIGMFLAWAIIRGLEGEDHQDDSGEELDSVRNRQMTGRQFLLQACDETLGDRDLNDEGAAFAAAYYGSGSGSPSYLEDYDAVLKGDLPSAYYVEDTWANFDKLADVLDRRFADWQSKRSPTA